MLATLSSSKQLRFFLFSLSVSILVNNSFCQFNKNWTELINMKSNVASFNEIDQKFWSKILIKNFDQKFWSKLLIKNFDENYFIKVPIKIVNQNIYQKKFQKFFKMYLSKHFEHYLSNLFIKTFHQNWLWK